MVARGSGERRSGGFLTKLARDRRGNTLAIMAAALVPVIGFAGSAIDLSRLYVVKVRLQQACDAGALAGRKAMTDNNPATSLDTAALTQANTFFANNFRSGFYQTTSVAFTPVKTVDGTSTVANAVTATANATVPMALMSFFGVQPVTLSVTCRANYDLADSDIMFVLDTTGSMSCRPSDPTSCAGAIVSYTRSDGTTGYHSQETGNSGSNMSKIEALRQSVILFDTTMRSNADPSTHFRYGFVTYSSAVNVGNVIPSGYLQNSTWTYQSRHVTGDYNYGSTSTATLTNIPQANCVTQRYPATGYATSGPTWSTSYPQAEYYYNLTWSAANGGTCSGTQQPLRAMWRYEPVAYDVSQFSTGASVANASRLDGLTSKWRGCVEELNTTAGATSFDVNNLPDDLNPDVIPTAASNKWRPMWPDVIWLRNPGTTSQDVKDEDSQESRAGTGSAQYPDYSGRPGGSLDQSGATACGMPAQRLQVMTASQVQNYVYNNDFQPFGGTYHDVGMIWGTRMLSPDGVFKADTASWPGRNTPSRTIVFMTDGTMAPQLTIYGQYGMEFMDNRIDGGSGNWGNDTAYHNARFRIECDAAKKKGITVYTIALGVHGAALPDLDYCSSTGSTYFADDTTTLKSVFQSIAQRIAMLRITK